MSTPDPTSADLGPANPDTDDLPEEGAGLSLALPDALTGERLDKALAAALADRPEGAGLSRSRLKSLIEEGRVAADGRTIVDASHRVKQGQIFAIDLPEPETAVPEPQDIPLTILYEDPELLVIDKAAEMVVHPAAGNRDGTLVNALLHHCRGGLSGIGGVARPGIVHRLDKGTSGLMVVAKTDRAHQGLAAQFADRTLSRTYRALVWGAPVPPAGEVEGNIGRHPSDRKRMAVLPKGGKPALTRYRMIRAYGGRVGTADAILSQVECKLATGRTHQIRVHLTHIGYPLLGDPLYGRARTSLGKGLPERVRMEVVGFPRQALHAWSLEFRHPTSGETMRFESELPSDMQQLVAVLESV
ncbi:MAG TPA: RluA family pseudouridine synthase [Azospirillaceae bacterium]|nr:RluA family pseudouridine synthase [Azospirillaceae bacterium]